MDAILHTDKDVVVLSPTGSGKTLAYMLPLSQRLKKDVEVIQAICCGARKRISTTVRRSYEKNENRIAIHGSLWRSFYNG